MSSITGEAHDRPCMHAWDSLTNSEHKTIRSNGYTVHTLPTLPRASNVKEIGHKGRRMAHYVIYRDSMLHTG